MCIIHSLLVQNQELYDLYVLIYERSYQLKIYEWVLDKPYNTPGCVSCRSTFHLTLQKYIS